MATRSPTLASQQAPALYRVRPSAIWGFLTSQPASFWLVNIYLFIEYVRPQQVWPVIDILPWGQSILILTLVAALIEGRLNRLPTVAGPLLIAFSVVVILSSLTATYPDLAISWWELYFSWVLVYLLITSIVTTEKRFFIFTLAFLLYSFKMSQHGFRSWVFAGFGFRDWGATGGPGWFHNSGEFGIQMCVFLPLAVEFILALRRHWGGITRWFFYLFPITAVASIVASSSRGAIVGAAAVGLWWVIRSKHRVRSLVLIAVLGAVTWAVVPAEQKARFATAGEDETSTARIERWEAGIEMAMDNPVLGIGYKNWIAVYGDLSHNIFIEAVSELGFAGLFAFISLIVATFVINARTRRLVRRVPGDTWFLRHMAYGLDGALIGFMGSGFFVTVLYYPYFWINLAMTVSLHIAAKRRVAQYAYSLKQDQARVHRPETPAGALG